MLQPNDIIACKYIIKTLLGEGGSGQVYLAKQITTSNLYAIKTISTTDSHAIKLVQRETQTLKRLNHESIVRFIEEGYDDDYKVAFLVLEYLEGSNIKDFFNQDILLQTKIKVFLQVLDAITHAHSKEVIHRDIKPENIKVVDNGDMPLAKVLDFGIAAITTTILTQAVERYYTPLFAPPEQIECRGVCRESDIYSLAMTFLYLLSNHEARVEFYDAYNKEALYPAAAQTLGVEKPSDSPLISLLIQATDPSRANRPRLDEIRKSLSDLLVNYAESIPIVFIPTQLLKDSILSASNSDTSPLRVKKYLESKLGNGLSCLYFKQIPNREEQDDRITVEIGNEDTSAVFRGFIKNDAQDRIILFSEREFNPQQAEILFDNGVSIQALPQIVIGNFSSKGVDLSDLVDALKQQNRIIEDEKLGKASKGDLFAKWQSVIDLEKKIINERKLSFSYVSKEYRVSNQQLVLTLKQPIPIEEFDTITSPPMDVTISVKGRVKNVQIPIGRITDGESSKSGETFEKLYVSLGDFCDPEVVMTIADQGQVETNVKAQESEIDRRRRALRAMRYGDSENSHLCNVIASPSTAPVFEPLVIHQFCNSELDESQRGAVCKALATDDIFLIQGPPGTGKTSVITEIILQILTRHPRHKILIASQSNVAVDNVLTRLAKVKLNDREIELLRVGREEKIEEDAKRFEIEKAILNWQSSIRAKSIRTWEEYQNESLTLIQGVKRLSDIEILSELQEKRYKLSKSILQDINLFNKDLLLTEETSTLSAVGDDAAAKIFDRMQIDDEILQKIKEYFQKFGIELPQQRSISQWLDEEYKRLNSLLGDENKNYVQFLRLKTLHEEWNERLKRKQADLVPLFLEKVNVIGATCLGVANLKEVSFDWVIIDEAGRSTAPETFVPMTKGKKVILVGDHKQLPPIIDRELQERVLQEKDISKRALETSLFEFLYEKLPNSKKITLSHQYRMHPDIGSLVSNLFYDKAVSSEKVNLSEKMHRINNLEKAVYWVSTNDATPEHAKERSFGTSYTNSYEANVIKAILKFVQTNYPCVEIPKSVGVIAGYAAQVETLEKVITPHDQQAWHRLNIAIHTVDAFQGGECDIIIYDLVRNNKERRLGFTSDYRRLNVALSRARQLLIIVGNDVMAYEGKAPKGQINPFSELIEFIDANTNSCAILPSKSFSRE